MEDINKYLRNRHIMTISTVDNLQPWICFVFYQSNDDGELYFMSSKDSRHAIEMAANTQIACGITDTDQGVVGRKRGIQLTGNVDVVIDPRKILWFVNLWKKKFGKFKYSIKDLTSLTSKSRIYKVVPTYIKYMDTELYDSGYYVWDK